MSEIQKQCIRVFNKDCKEMGIKLIRFEGTTGIIRCNHKEKENTIRLLKSITKINSKKVQLTAIATSGTIRSLIKKHLANLYLF